MLIYEGLIKKYLTAYNKYINVYNLELHVSDLKGTPNHDIISYLENTIGGSKEQVIQDVARQDSIRCRNGHD